MIEFGIRQLFPAFLLADRNGYALARAIEAGLNYALEIIDAGVAMLQDTDAMPEWRLDELAWEYNVTWYDSKATLEEKRQTIADARRIYGIAGTPEAVLGALNGVFGAGRLEEWWQYDGEPGHFNVYTTSPSATQEDYDRFIAIINAVKNVRSVMDNIFVNGDAGTAETHLLTNVGGIYCRREGFARLR